MESEALKIRNVLWVRRVCFTVMLQSSNVSSHLDLSQRQLLLSLTFISILWLARIQIWVRAIRSPIICVLFYFYFLLPSCPQENEMWTLSRVEIHNISDWRYDSLRRMT